MNEFPLPWTQAADGSIVGPGWRTLYFSTSRFITDICGNGCCFVCGRSRYETSFNDEHILPRWLLKKYALFGRTISLPNLSGFRYGQYTVPCCADCNALLGARLEQRVSQLLAGGMRVVGEYVERRGAGLFFLWIALIFLKTHLRDREFRFHLDQRKGDAPIADFYDWADLHHIHCLVRSVYTGAVIEPTAFGSCLILEAKTEPLYEHFDYADLYQPQSVLLRVGDVCIIAVLNDSGAAFSKFLPDLEKLTGALGPLQLREVFAHLAFINTKLKVRPQFRSRLGRDGTYRIVGEHPPQVELKHSTRRDFGKILYACTHETVRRLRQSNRNEMLEGIRAGRWTFLFDEKGKFIDKSVLPPTAT